MEQSSCSETYTSQLETIKCIENNLLQMKSRLNFLEKQQSRSEAQMHKLFDSTIPIIKSKIVQTEKLNKTRNWQNEIKQSKIHKAEEVKMSRLQQQIEVNKNTMEIHKSKSHGSFHIREMSKKNNKIIIDAKNQWIQEKRKKSELIKANKQQSRRKVQQFYQHKQHQLRKMRFQQNIQLERKINKIGASLSMMHQKQEQQEQRYKTNHDLLTKLKRVVNHLYIMRPQAFESIVQKYRLKPGTELNDEIIQVILEEVDGCLDSCQNSPGYEKDQNRIDRRSSQIKLKAELQNRINSQARRYQSELPDIEVNYGDNSQLSRAIR